VARPASDIAARIVIAARGRFLLDGVDGAALRQIAKDAGTNIGMIYYYFKTKDDLFFAVVENAYANILRDVTELLGGDAPEDQRLARLYGRLAHLSDEEFAVVRLIMREVLVSSTRLTRLGELFLRGHIPVALRCLQEGVAHGRLRSDLPALPLMAATFVLGIVPQLIRRLVASSDAPLASQLPSADLVAQMLAKILLDGIGDPQRPRVPETPTSKS
jgi:AcrR family transcriptional regulator